MLDSADSPDSDHALGERTVFAMPGHLLRRCQQIAVGIFLEECRAHELTPLQFVTLATLAERGPLDQTALGRAAALDRTTAAVVIRSLVQRGLAERTPSRRDRRAKPVALTAAGRSLVEDAWPAVEAAQERILAPLGEAEQRQLVRLLQRLATDNNAYSRAPQRDF